MTAIGLGGLANLTGDQEMETVARQKYGLALQHTAKSIQNSTNIEPTSAMRAVVMLALFELVRGNQEVSAGVKTHIMGAAALLGSIIDKVSCPGGGSRWLLQLCFSLFVPCYLAGVGLPGTAFDWIMLSDKFIHTEDKPSLDLILIIVRFVQLAASLKAQAFSDGRPKTVDAISQALQLEADLEAWEMRQEGIWSFSVEEGVFPAEAVFNNQFHAYTNMWVARVWNHYRWARILANQLILDFVDRYPTSSPALVSATRQRCCLDQIRRLAHDVLVSIPTHWRHPRLTRAQCDTLDKTDSGEGVGAAGIPGIMAQLKVAACAPGVPHGYWAWSLNIMETVWWETGMLQARSLAQILRDHRERLQRGMSEGILTKEAL